MSCCSLGCPLLCEPWGAITARAAARYRNGHIILRILGTMLRSLSRTVRHISQQQHQRSSQYLLQQQVHDKHTLVLVRHGESEWNKANRFTGWYDVALSEKVSIHVFCRYVLHQSPVMLFLVAAAVFLCVVCGGGVAAAAELQHHVVVNVVTNLDENECG